MEGRISQGDQGPLPHPLGGFGNLRDPWLPCGGESAEMIQLFKPQGVDREAISRIREMVERQLPAELDDAAVMVQELKCLEPGCPPVETVIVVLVPHKPRKFKVFKSVAQVTEADVQAGISILISGTPAPEHAPR